ncbi:uncharacterized protein VTP21DRAFT_9586 [Calcarisporiella thermophila]|uniref:uncharacterized protein n=1 Tax=Calcarisporiella thermophila TaxID=911321 RepID=UPI0037425AF3
MSEPSDSAKPKKSSVYTRTGDKGTSALFNGARKPKTDQVFKALGAVDELNSSLGIAQHYCKVSNNGLADQLIEIQCRMLEIGANVATPKSTSSETQLERTKLHESTVSDLEAWIDLMDSKLPPLRNFILPSGGESSVFLHQCRSICRRAEREVVDLVTDDEVDEVALKFLNRLSDYLFVAARYAAQHDGAEENLFRKRELHTRSLQKDN